MNKSRGKKVLKKPITQKTPILQSFMVWIVTIVMFSSVVICVINSLTNYCVKDIWFFQNLAIGGFTFVMGFLMGENAK